MMRSDIDIRQIYGGSEVEAEYSPPENESLRNNPLIEALHPDYSAKKAGSLLRRWPRYSHEYRAMTADMRRNQILDVFNYLEPLPSTILLERKMSRLIRYGYQSRNPIKSEWTRQLHVLFENFDMDRGGAPYLPSIPSNITGMALIGGSGSGKTKWIQNILGLYNQVIHHVVYQGKPFQCKQIVWLKFECTVTSPRDFFLELLQSFDDLLVTNYAELAQNKRWSIDNIIRSFARLAYLHGLGVLVIDEIQRLLRVNSQYADEILRFLVRLTNIMKVPIVLVGTFSAIPWMQKDFPLTRRIVGPMGDLIWNNLKLDPTWEHLLKRLWRFQYTSTPTILTDDLSEILYEETQGIPDLLVKLYMLTQAEVIGRGDEVITPQIIRRVARERMAIVKPLINKLKTKTYYDAELELGDSALSDLLPTRAIHESINMYEQQAIAHELLDRNTIEKPENEGLSQGENPLASNANQIPENVILEPEDSSTQANSHLIQGLPKGKEIVHKDSISKSKHEKQMSLVDMVKNARKGETPYQVLKRHGVIRDLVEILTH